MTRELIIQVIREVVRGWPIEDVQVAADNLPTLVGKGATQFCNENELGPWFELQIRHRNVSVASELIAFIEESKQAVVQHKEVETSGDNSNGKS